MLILVIHWSGLSKKLEHTSGLILGVINPEVVMMCTKGLRTFTIKQIGKIRFFMYFF